MLAAVGRLGIESPTYRSVAAFITVPPLLVLTEHLSPLLVAESATENTQTVCFCMSAYLLARLTV